MKRVALGELVEFTGGGTPSRANAEYWGGPIPWVTVKDFVGPSISRAQEHITEAGVANSATNLVPTGTILIPTRMALGKIAVTSVDLTINQDIKALTLRSPALVYQRYLFHWLGSQASAIEALGQGATVKGVTLNVLRELLVPLPPLQEQRRIADILDKADAVRRKRKEAIALTEELLRSAFLEMVGPVAPGYEGWPEATFESLAAPTSGAMRTGPFGSDLRHSEFVDSGVAVLGIDNAVRNRFAWDERRYISLEKYQGLKRYTVKPNDVIVTIMGTTGRAAVVPRDIPLAITTKHLATLTLNRELAEPEYVAQSIHRHPSVLTQIERANRGAIMSGLNLGLIKSLVVRRPPIKRQREFADFTAKVRLLESHLAVCAEATSTLFNGLVQRAFSGELSAR